MEKEMCPRPAPPGPAPADRTRGREITQPLGHDHGAHRATSSAVGRLLRRGFYSALVAGRRHLRRAGWPGDSLRLVDGDREQPLTL